VTCPGCCSFFVIVVFRALTYMSIHDELKARCSEKRLFRLDLGIPGDPVERAILLSEDVQSLLTGPWQSETLRYRSGRLRGDLEEFIKGETISACLRPFEARSAYMGRLAPIQFGMWDIRSRDPTPALRVVGLFAATDVFVALRWAPRSVQPAWIDRPPLGCRDSREWRDIITQCKVDWRNLFLSFAAITGDNIHDYISRNVRLV
jgi:hypothetical protein